MRKNRWGRIVNLSSVGGMMAMPTMGSYRASKFALEGASEALWYELKPWNIKVVLVQPGFVHSNSFRGVYWSDKAKACMERDDGYAVYYRTMGTFIEGLMNRAVATPNSIAAKIVHAMELENPRLRIPATIDAYFFYILRRILPRQLYHWILFRNLPSIEEWGKST
jgi:short-subunit dehydrogenase